MVMIADIPRANCLLRLYFALQRNIKIYIWPEYLQYCQGNLSCKRRIVIREIKERKIIVSVKISGI
jgi:hypothetical protein